MSSFDFLSRAVSCRYNDEIKRACDCLFTYFNLNHFYYTKLSDTGYLTSLDSHADWSQYYSSNKMYFGCPDFRHPKLVERGVQLMKDVQSESHANVYNAGREKFDFNLTLQIAEEIPNGIEIFGFSSKDSGEAQVSLLLNELPLIRLFAKKFCELNPFLVKQLDDNQIDMASIMGETFYEKPFSFKPSSREKRAFLEKMGVGDPASLTGREVEILRLVIQGYSAGKIASQVFLSKRTVEHHVERIKEKLGCHSKAELIQKAREFEGFGVLMLKGAEE